MGTSLVLLNTGIDELGNPRLRDAAGASRSAGHRIGPADPTPALQALPPSRGRLAGLVHSFSRAALLGRADSERPGSAPEGERA
jgi:hypothetical protein